MFGNGERTGNCDLVTVALNMYTQGVAPGLDFSNLEEDRADRNLLQPAARPIPAIPMPASWSSRPFRDRTRTRSRKALLRREARNDELWNVPYLPIDPADLGCSYEAVIRVNSQSGKGGVAWVLQQDKGLKLPKRMQGDFSRVVQDLADTTSRETARRRHLDGLRGPLLPRRAAALQAHRLSGDRPGRKPRIRRQDRARRRGAQRLGPGQWPPVERNRGAARRARRRPRSGRL